VRNPSTAIDLSLVPGDFAVGANGIWRANSMTGTVRRHTEAFATCTGSAYLERDRHAVPHRLTGYSRGSCGR
jgi:hypothetical protein